MEVYNDLDGGLVNFFCVLRDPEKAARLHMLVAATPYSREEFETCRDTWASCEDVVERARRWFVVARFSFSGVFGNSWSRALASSTGGMAMSTRSWMSAHEQLARAHHRLMRVQIEQQDFRDLIPGYDSTDTLFYLDPPYIHDTRRSGAYAHEMSDADHIDLVNLLLDADAKMLLSGYRHAIYRPLERAGWKRREFKVHCSAVARTKRAGTTGDGGLAAHRRVECVWISPSAQPRKRRRRHACAYAGRIHGYRYAGRVHGQPYAA